MGSITVTLPSWRYYSKRLAENRCLSAIAGIIPICRGAVFAAIAPEKPI
ncbi:MAG TPA: hypothetical protein V6C78_18435 [Crinalium sp.]